MKAGKFLERFLTYSGAILVALVIIAPPLWLFISSISSIRELLSVPVHWIPQEPTFERYLKIIFATGEEAAAVFRRSMLNSLIVSSSVTLICVSIGTLAAYSFARLKFPGQAQMIYVLLFSYMLPPIMIIVPLYDTMSRLGWIDTLHGLVVLYAALILPFAIWIMKGYFQTIPSDLEDAAMIDGCSRLGALTRVVMPLSAPGVIATTLFCFLMAWEEFLLALILTSSPRAKTLPVAIAEFTGRHAIDYGMMATGGVIAAIPPVLIALLFQKYLVSGLTSGAVKG